MISLTYVYVYQRNMLYQLPNGRVIYLTIEEFLALNDNEFNNVIQSNVGDDAPTKHFFGSYDKEKEDEPIEEIDYSIDFNFDEDEPSVNAPFDINNIPDETSE